MISQAFQALKFEIRDKIGYVTFNRPVSTNPFSRQMTLELTELCNQYSNVDPSVEALIFFGGAGRSFSVGGDFNDVSRLDQETDIRAYLGEIIDLYISILQVRVPVVSAIDRFAIGQGLQVALMTDWRIGTELCQTQMPELKNGVACPLGSQILEFLFGRGRMLECILDCEFISATESRVLGILNRVVPVEELLRTSTETARRFSGYPTVSFAATKKIHNARLMRALEDVREDASLAHVAAFLNKSGKSHFEKILKK